MFQLLKDHTGILLVIFQVSTEALSSVSFEHTGSAAMRQDSFTGCVWVQTIMLLPQGSCCIRLHTPPWSAWSGSQHDQSSCWRSASLNLWVSSIQGMRGSED